MSTRYGSVKLRVPTGFSVLLEKFTREVLREQPTNIPEFGAVFFQQLLADRNLTGRDPTIEVSHIEEQLKHGFMTSSQKPLRPVNSVTRQEEINSETAAVKIQAGYRGYRVRKERRRERDQRRRNEEEAASKIQAGYRGYKTRKNLKSGPVDVDVKEKGISDAEETEARLYGDEENNAAIRIQANYRGYQTRKTLKSKSKEKKVEFQEPEPLPDLTDPEMEAAALKIQASFRGHQVRKEMHQDPKDQDHDQEPVVSETEQEKEEVESMPDLNDPEMQAAALKIQASFRGHQVRRDMHQDKVEQNQDELADSSEKIEDEEEAGDGSKLMAAAHDSGNQEDEEEKEILTTEERTVTDEKDTVKSPEPADIEESHAEMSKSDEELAALKIQSHYRGFKTRKDLKQKGEGDAPVQAKSDEDEKERDLEEEEDIAKVDEEKDDVQELSSSTVNPDEEVAAVKIQAGYRGYRTRKQLKKPETEDKVLQDVEETEKVDALTEEQ